MPLLRTTIRAGVQTANHVTGLVFSVDEVRRARLLFTVVRADLLK